MYLDKTRWASTEMPSPLCSVKPSLTRVRVDLLTQPYPTNPRRLSVRPAVPSARSRPDGERVARRRENEAMREPTPHGRPAAFTARAVRAQARCGSARSGTQTSCARRAGCGARSKSKRSSAFSPAATHITALPASTAMPVDTITCSPTPARRATSARAATMLLYGEWVEGNVLEPVPHRQYVFTVPRLLRPGHFG